MVALPAYVAGLQRHPKDVEVQDQYQIPSQIRISQTIGTVKRDTYLHANLLVHALLLLFDLLLEFLQRGSVRRSAVSL